jgi:hypothetical protein
VALWRLHFSQSRSEGAVRDVRDAETSPRVLPESGTRYAAVASCRWCDHFRR